MSLEYERNGHVKPPYYSGYFDLGPVRIPPLVPFTGLVDRVTGTTYYVGQNGTAVVLQTSKPAGINTKVYQPYDGPFLAYGTRLGCSSAALVLDTPATPLTGASAPVWIYSTTNPLGETYPEPTNYPAPLPPVIPGIPSTSPVPTGGGYAAFNAAAPTGITPVYLTVILTAGMKRNLAWWNGSAWVTPAGVPLTGIIGA